MNRRHVALILAVAASIGTSEKDEGPDDPVYLFQGLVNEQAGPVTLDEAHPTSVWEITAQVVLPPEAETTSFDGGIGARVWFVDPDAEHDLVSYRLTDCAGVALTEVEYATSGEGVGSIAKFDSFADCVPEIDCTSTACLEITTTNKQLPVQVHCMAVVWIDAATESSTDEAIEVPIELTFEEIEP
jgi:hypothetical protein